MRGFTTAEVAEAMECRCFDGTFRIYEKHKRGPADYIYVLLIPLLLIVVLIVVMIIPQRKRDKKVKEMLNALKPGDRVRTIGGIYGTISSVKDDVVVLTVGPDKVKLVFARGAISQVEETGVENTMEEEVHE